MTVTRWICAIVILCLATFGILGCVRVIIMIGGFLLGCYIMFTLAIPERKSRLTKKDILNSFGDSNWHPDHDDEIQMELDRTSDYQKRDKKITNHTEVDRLIIEIMEQIIDEYVTIWYSTIASDMDLVDSLKSTALDAIIKVVNYLRLVDWSSYITGKLIDDLASHLRIFRGAGGGVLTTNIKQQRRRSPARSPARNVTYHRRNKSDTDVTIFHDNQPIPSTSFMNGRVQSGTFEDRFFEIEYEAEKKIVSRKSVCTDPVKKVGFIREISHLLIFLIVDKKKLRDRLTLSLLRSLLSHFLTSLLNYIVDPDTINTLLLRLCSKDSFSSDAFLTVLRNTDNIQELKSTLEIVQNEMHSLSSNDIGECDITVKQQLSSLQFVTRLLTDRTSILTPASSMIITKLPLGFLLDNHLALCYFLDFAHSMSAHSYIFCYISIEAWETTTLQQLNEIAKTRPLFDPDSTPSGRAIRSAASNIYDQYFSKKALNYIEIPISILEALFSKMNMRLTDQCLVWFDDIKKFIHSKLKGVETAFRNSHQFERLLAELDLEGISSTIENPRYLDHRRTGSSGATIYVPKLTVTTPGDKTKIEGTHNDCEEDSIPATSQRRGKNCIFIQETLETLKPSYLSPEIHCRLEVSIVETGLMRERGRAFGVYALEVKRWDPTSGKEHCWHVYRRYSDFHELHTMIKEAYPELSKMEFPSKKTFHNTSRNVLERRMATLSFWISSLASLGSPGGPPRYAPLHLYLLPFLTPRGPQDKHQASKNSILVQPLLQGMQTLKNVPEQLANTVDDILGGLSKIMSTNKNLTPNSMFCGQNPSNLSMGLENENVSESEELPLKMLLFLVDEVFELRSRNKWLRRQIISFLRQILTAMFADAINKKIIDTISSFTSPSSIASYLKIFQRTYLNNTKEKVTTIRDADAKARARVAAKTFLLSYRQDELKRLIGSQTTQRGLMTLFELFQNETLNTRLMFVLMEGLIKAVFHGSDVSKVFQNILNENPRSA